MPIKTLENQSHLEGTVMFLNAAIRTFLDRTANIHRNDEPFMQLKKMMSQNLYLAELRGANPEGGEKYNQIDLVGFKEEGTPVCFTLNTNTNLTVVDFKKEELLQRMSVKTQALIDDLKEKLTPESKIPYARL
ncbi:hypothetical protein [Legionella micdadei]|uniref:Uncharacterized protein n=1 Tax=Legionella micdadei TaxID=451 RepID=A0A098GAN1_LEGMI|nr:hypothetical protein [Legionella micdadei]ARG96348.1 hypothetical protein B6N58_00860 [Legionella micdadei]KTD29569.1 hypothetical protein Lmic_0641 [Legionella micdadei]NSL18034.1 hypothetical protein [Legionella micdadei]CEG59549.1 protein of unknown function [Legionella micdadei]SCX93332.1 hypothetical protein SAMN02982997_00416 [Legionella micdadei]